MNPLPFVSPFVIPRRRIASPFVRPFVRPPAWRERPPSAFIIPRRPGGSVDAVTFGATTRSTGFCSEGFPVPGSTESSSRALPRPSASWAVGLFPSSRKSSTSSARSWHSSAFSRSPSPPWIFAFSLHRPGYLSSIFAIASRVAIAARRSCRRPVRANEAAFTNSASVSSGSMASRSFAIKRRRAMAFSPFGRSEGRGAGGVLTFLLMDPISPSGRIVRWTDPESMVVPLRESTVTFRTSLLPSRVRTMSTTPSSAPWRDERVDASWVFSRANKDVNPKRSRVVLIARANPTTTVGSATRRAGDKMSNAARRSPSSGSASIAREMATAAFGRPPEVRNMVPSTSTWGPSLSLRTSHSTNSKRRSSMARSTSTPAAHSASLKRISGSDVNTTSAAPPPRRLSARNWTRNASFSTPAGPCTTTEAPEGRPPWMRESKPGIPEGILFTSVGGSAAVSVTGSSHPLDVRIGPAASVA